MNKVYLFIVFLFSYVPGSAVSEMLMPPFKDVEWDDVVYRSTLQKPFGEVSVRLQLNRDSGLEMIGIKIHGKVYKVDSDYLVNVDSPLSLKLTTSLAKNEGQSEIESFSISFEYGAPQRHFISDEGVCIGGCYEWIRNSMLITMDQKYSMSVEKGAVVGSSYIMAP